MLVVDFRSAPFNIDIDVGYVMHRCVTNFNWEAPPKPFDIPELPSSQREWRLCNDDTPVRTFADVLLIGINRRASNPMASTVVLTLYPEMKKNTGTPSPPSPPARPFYDAAKTASMVALFVAAFCGVFISDNIYERRFACFVTTMAYVVIRLAVAVVPIINRAVRRDNIYQSLCCLKLGPSDKRIKELCVLHDYDTKAVTEAILKEYKKQ